MIDWLKEADRSIDKVFGMSHVEFRAWLALELMGAYERGRRDG